MSPFIVLTFVVFKEHDQYVSVCRELDVASCGSNVEEAFAMIAEAVDLYLEDLADRGQLEAELKARNVRVEFEEPIPHYRLPVEVNDGAGESAPTYQFRRQQVPQLA